MLKILVYILLSFAGLSFKSLTSAIQLSLPILEPDEYESKVVICEASNAERVSWYGPKKNSIPEMRNKKVYSEVISSSNSKKLVFSNITKEESGNYTCKAEGKGVDEIVTLIVKVKVKPTFIDDQKVYYTQIGGNITVHCRLNIQPPPKIEWSFEGRKIESDAEFQILNEREQLLLHNVSEKNVGIYKCEVVVPETGDVAERELQLKLAKPPKMITLRDKNTFRALINTTAHLRCKVTADPSANITWFRNEKAFKQRDYPGSSIENMDNESILKLFFPTTKLTGPYKCEAVNILGRESLTLMLLEGVKPNAPRVYQREAFDTGYRFDFHEQSDSSQNVTFFKVLYKKHDDSNGKWEVSDFPKRISETVPYSLNELQPNTAYYYKVGACTDPDICTFTEEMSFKTTEITTGSANSLIQSLTAQLFLLPAFIINFYSKRY